MAAGKKEKLWRFKWHWFVIWLIVVGLGFVAAGEIVALRKGGVGINSVILWIVGAAVFVAALLITIFAALLLMHENVRSIKAGAEKLEAITVLLNKNYATLAHISQAGRLSEAAKAIVFRDAERAGLREAVLEKLYQQDFEATYAMIDQMAERSEFGSLAERLRSQADKYRNAGQEERINQIIAYVEKLSDDYEWAKAAAEIDRLIKTYGGSEQLKAMRQKLTDKKEQRKKELLQVWDEAVKKQETDHSLEILKELDLYLTPNEGLALQESARDVFRTKLHKLGVQFSMAVADRRWAGALQTGEQIIRDFPNSRMAQEIREKIDILRGRATDGS